MTRRCNRPTFSHLDTVCVELPTQQGKFRIILPCEKLSLFSSLKPTKHSLGLCLGFIISFRCFMAIFFIFPGSLILFSVHWHDSETPLCPHLVIYFKTRIRDVTLDSIYCSDVTRGFPIEQWRHELIRCELKSLWFCWKLGKLLYSQHFGQSQKPCNHAKMAPIFPATCENETNIQGISSKILKLSSFAS